MVLFPRSLRGRLLAGILAGMTLILVAGGVLLHQVLDARLREEFESSVLDKSYFYELAAYFKGPAGSLCFEMRTSEYFENNTRHADDYAQVSFKETSARIPLKWNGNLPMDLAHDASPAWRDVVLPDGRPGRACGRIVYPPMRDNVFAAPRPMNPPQPVKLVVARETASLQATQRRLRNLLIQAGIGSVVLVMLAAAIIVRHGMHPVGELDRQIDVMPLADPGMRFALPGAPSELEPVVDRLNALMDRVTAAIEHERQFASNAAHELRNPLAAIRAQCEAALSRSRSAEEYEDTLADVLESQQGMQRVVDHLLLMARLEAGPLASELPREPVSLTRMVRKAWRACVDRAAERRLAPTWSVEDSDVLLPAAMTEMLVGNLFDNAVNYTPAGGSVAIEARVTGGEIRLRVSNTNPGLDAAQVEQSFSPFWRADPNASGHRGNAGIGLALCRRIAAVLQGTLNGWIEGDRVVYEVCLPALPVPLPAEVPAAPVA